MGNCSVCRTAKELNGLAQMSVEISKIHEHLYLLLLVRAQNMTNIMRNSRSWPWGTACGNRPNPVTQNIATELVCMSLAQWQFHIKPHNNQNVTKSTYLPPWQQVVHVILLCHHVLAENSVAFKLGAGRGIKWRVCIHIIRWWHIGQRHQKVVVIVGSRCLRQWVIVQGSSRLWLILLEHHFEDYLCPLILNITKLLELL